MLKQLRSFCKTLTLSQVDLENYCRAKRYERYDENGAYVSSLGFHNKIHSILVFPGAVEVAISCNADIVPIAIARKDKKYYVNIGSNISYAGNECTDKYQLTYDLRDVLATLKWGIISQIEPLKRSEIDVNYEKDFLHEIMGTQVATYTVQDVLDTRYKPKGQTDYDEAFEHLKYVRLNKENAFLFREKDK